MVHGALCAAPVQLPAGVAVPEAEALAAAVARARQRLGEAAAAAASARGDRMELDELLTTVLTTMA